MNFLLSFFRFQLIYEIFSLFLASCLCETHWLLILAAVKCFSMLGKRVEIPNIEIEISINNQTNEDEMEEEVDEQELVEYKSK